MVAPVTGMASRWPSLSWSRRSAQTYASLAVFELIIMLSMGTGLALAVFELVVALVTDMGLR